MAADRSISEQDGVFPRGPSHRSSERPQTAERTHGPGVSPSDSSAPAGRLEDPAQRARRVRELKAAIAAGTYETPELLELAVARMLEQLQFEE